jgi:hypothetical protein
MDNPFTVYGTTKLVGGVNNLGLLGSVAKRMTLPDHKRLRIKFQFWALGTWEVFNFIL